MNPIEAPRFEITLSPDRPPAVAVQNDSRPKTQDPRLEIEPKPTAWKEVNRGSVTIKIYSVRPNGQGPYTIAWRESATGRRQRAMRSQKSAALAFADAKATELANGETWRTAMGPADYASFLRAMELAAPTGKPLEIVTGIGAECLKLTAATGMSPQEAIAYCLAQRPSATATAKNAQEIFEEMLIAREKDGASQNTIDDLSSRVKKFVAQFPGPLIHVTAQQINEWLRKLPCSRRTRNNYRGNIVDFYRFARESSYLPKTWNPLDEVPRVKNEPVRITIFTPEEIVKLLAARTAMEKGTRKTMIPFLAIGAFAGCRHEEMSASGLPTLDWLQVDFEKNEIHVLEEVARKIGHDRILPMQPNLAEWLRPHAKTSGPICELANANNELQKTALAAGIKWKDNGLRKSFISYRLALTKNIGTVATEAGTSPDRIRHNYKKTVPDREAKRWFNIWPTNAEVLQLKFSL